MLPNHSFKLAHNTTPCELILQSFQMVNRHGPARGSSSSSWLKHHDAISELQWCRRRTIASAGGLPERFFRRNSTFPLALGSSNPLQETSHISAQPAVPIKKPVPHQQTRTTPVHLSSKASCHWQCQCIAQEPEITKRRQSRR